MGLFTSSQRSEPSAPRDRGEAEPVRRADLTAVPAGAGWQAVDVRGGGRAELWPSFAVDFLAGCEEFKPLAEHLHEYARYHALEPDQVREINHWAQQMIERGLLTGTRRLVERCMAASPGEGEPARIEAIGIPTAGNEARLRRVITSFARNARENGRAMEITIAANGPAAGGVAALAAELGRSESVAVTVLENDIEGLARRAGVDAAIVAFGLGDPLGVGFACGANRNGLLLRNAGRAFLSIDDDVACEMAGPPGRARDGLTVFSSRDGFERWFYPEYEKAFEGRRPVTADYAGLHERMLGRSVGSVLRAGKEIDFVGISDEMLRRLAERDGRIVATFTGHFGHPGVPTSYYYLTYRRETLERLTGAGEEQYRAFLSSGGVFALAPRMSVADASLSPGMAIGIDARTLIPPFPPVMHAEDFVWGAAVWQCCAAGFAGHLPVALRHDPGIGRGIIAPPLEGRPVAMWEFAHVLRGLLLNWTAPPGMLDTEARMDSLGRHLCELGGAPPAEFHEYLRSFVLTHESDKIAFMEQCLDEENDAPDFWRKDIEDYIEQTREALAEPDFDIPFDMREKWPAPDVRVLMQRLVAEYGNLLRAWPVLTAATK